MRIFDQHLHSWNSFDCDTPPEDNVRSAIASGLSGLTFTEHFDTHREEWDACVYDDEKIEQELADLRVRFSDRIFIGKGIEICYQPQRMDFILEFLRAHSFDVVLLSVHWAFGKPIHHKEHFDGIDCEAFIRRYLEAVREAAAHLVQMKRDGYQPFHILGHLDLVRRYAFRYFDYAGPLNEPALIDEILSNCLQAGIIPEINTSSLRQGLSAPMPGEEIVHRYAELGGTMMSFGSDAHWAESVGAGAEFALDLMRNAGLSHLAVFQNGELQPEPLND
ncbi:MAG: histidinol-phosphatase HisJ family protein [Planctomycetes bacterium]|nr:histidinol-phosphatase HisJ family protein [Planctomycetota bacterium]